MKAFIFDKSYKCAEPLPPSRISSNKKFQSINFITSLQNLYYSISKCVYSLSTSPNKFHLTLGSTVLTGNVMFSFIHTLCVHFLLSFNFVSKWMCAVSCHFILCQNPTFTIFTFNIKKEHNLPYLKLSKTPIWIYINLEERPFPAYYSTFFACLRNII